MSFKMIFVPFIMYLISYAWMISSISYKLGDKIPITDVDLCSGIIINEINFSI